MDQIKIGALLRELRKEKSLSQEQLAEQFGVSSRSVSRWENGNTMPDISLLIELADFYDIEIRELLSGERKRETMDPDMKETLVMVADYTKAEKEKLVQSLFGMTAASAAAFGIIGIIVLFRLDKTGTTFDSMVQFLTVIGLIYSVMSYVRVKQLTGKMNRKQHQKFAVVMLIIGVAVLLLSILLILLATGAIGTAG
ncbi:MAG: helix-turn-helix domain-containing protein [Oscillospiraceae bacterium]|nr:helix-turn-helix domain-containing protein [Oscillospiraceae bacterium]